MKRVPASSMGDLFQILREGRPHTRAELAAKAGLSLSTVGAHINRLRDLGLVAAYDDAVSTGGRRPGRIAFNHRARLIAAADLGATRATIAITDLAGKRLSTARTEFETSREPELTLSQILDTIGNLLKEISRDRRDLIAIGMGIPGPVASSTGRLYESATTPGWDGFDIPGAIQRRIPVPVLIDKNVNLMAVGERSVRRPVPDELVFVNVSTCISAGIISGGELRRGAEGAAGDIGHIPIPRGAGVTCMCGNTGCLEAVASGPALAAALRAQNVNASTSSDVIDLVCNGDARAAKAVRQAGRDLGTVLNACVSCLNPSLIVIGGPIVRAGEQLLAGIEEVVYGRAMPPAARSLRIERARAVEEAGVIGASIIAIEYALSPGRLENLSTLSVSNL